MAVEDSVPSQCTAAMFELLQEQSQVVSEVLWCQTHTMSCTWTQRHPPPPPPPPPHTHTNSFALENLYKDSSKSTCVFVLRKS